MMGHKGIDRREYVRLQTVFPVEFQVIGEGREKALSGLIQGFTRNIGEGGMCIEVNDLDDALAVNLRDRSARLSLTINIPLSAEPVKALATATWLKKVKETYPNRYLIGVSYDLINELTRQRVIGYAKWLHRKPKVIAGVVACLILVSALVVGHNLWLRSENRVLVERLVKTLEKRSHLEEELAKFDERKASLEAKLAESGERISFLEARMSDVEKEGSRVQKGLEERSELMSSLRKVLGEKEALEKKLAMISVGRALLEEDLDRLERKKAELEELSLDKMYRWLKVRQNRRSGLVLSYEGDPSLRGWAFTYDQSLVAQNFVLFGDYANAMKLFDFFKDRAEKVHGGFANAYYFNAGRVAEYTVHTGPNIWLAIAILQYMDKTNDRRYLDLAKEIGDWVIDLQSQDPDGGIRGGPRMSWFSTEHNLDAYALFRMLYEVTEDSEYRRAAERALKWIRAYTYTESEGRLYRGKGDATIATDTFAWAICAIGPERLLEVGMDPDGIIKFAMDNCEVTVDYTRPNDEVVKVTGFDFAKAQNIPRGGIVSAEWTAQMIVALEVMSGWYAGRGNGERAVYYSRKAKFYLSQLGKLTVSSPSWTGQGEGCLPYATQGYVDTGHGWRTPKGRQTGSVASTAFGIFAMRGHNPLKLAGGVRGQTLKFKINDDILSKTEIDRW